MKKFIGKILFPIFLAGFLLTGCKDIYSEKFMALEPVYMSYDDLRASVKMVSQQDLVKPGKIYTIGNYFYINEYFKGVHVYNNVNPASPQYIGFINIPGNVDIVVKDNILYADSYVDLVAIDLSDPAKAREVGRAKNAFNYTVAPYNQSGYRVGKVDITKGVVVDWEVKRAFNVIGTQTYQMFPIHFGSRYADDFSQINTKLDALATSGGSSSGVGGSMARFGLTGNSLLAVDRDYFYHFDLADQNNPKLYTKGYISFSPIIETMFLYGKYMFLGTRNGMLVFDISDVNKPKYVSQFWHTTGCDPVVVQNNRAYITIRGGNLCRSLINRLDVLDITDILKPALLRSYNMDNPYGLGISDNILFVCDGTSGLKVYDATDPLLVAEHQLASFPNIQAYDVIPLGKSLLMIGSDGFYQYDYSDLKNIRQISVIQTKK
jgi:hypothetical protein